MLSTIASYIFGEAYDTYPWHSSRTNAKGSTPAIAEAIYRGTCSAISNKHNATTLVAGRLPRGHGAWQGGDHAIQLFDKFGTLVYRHHCYRNDLEGVLRKYHWNFQLSPPLPR